MAGITQAELGLACALSQSKISRFECGQEAPTVAERRAMAQALEIDATALGVGGESEDDVHRRELLSAAAGIGIGAVLPAAPATAQSPAPGWDKALFHSVTPITPMTSGQIDAGLVAVARHCAAARYNEAAEAIPGLITATEHLARRSGPHGAVLLTRAYALATAVAVKERGEIGWITADRAVQAARRSQHPLALASAARAQFIVLRQRGHHGWARQIADAAVADLSNEELARPVVGHILLESAYGAAQSGKRSEAIALWEHGRDLGEKGPSATAWPDNYGPLTADQINRYALCVYHVLGDTRSAISFMSKVDARTMPTAERRARYRHDRAKLHRDLGDLPRALRLLRDHEEETPQDARRSSLRSMVSGMLTTSPALPGLRGFAEHIGAA